MRLAMKVFLLLTCSLVIIVESRVRSKRKPVDLCTIPVVLLMDRFKRSTCIPLMKLWVLRRGKCMEARQCIRGYSKNECEKHCIENRKEEKKTTKPQIQKTRSTCAFTFGPEKEEEVTVASTTKEPTIDNTTTTEGPRTRRTRRTRKPMLNEC